MKVKGLTFFILVPILFNMGNGYTACKLKPLIIDTMTPSNMYKLQP